MGSFFTPECGDKINNMELQEKIESEWRDVLLELSGILIEDQQFLINLLTNPND